MALKCSPFSRVLVLFFFSQYGYGGKTLHSSLSIWRHPNLGCCTPLNHRSCSLICFKLLLQKSRSISAIVKNYPIETKFTHCTVQCLGLLLHCIWLLPLLFPWAWLPSDSKLSLRYIHSFFQNFNRTPDGNQTEIAWIWSGSKRLHDVTLISTI